MPKTKRYRYRTSALATTIASWQRRYGILGKVDVAPDVRSETGHRAVRAELLALRIGADLDENGRIVGGSVVWVCARCWARGAFMPLGS